MPMQGESVPAFEPFAVLAHIAVFREGDDVDEFGAEAFAGSARGDVLRVASDPEVGEAVALARGRSKQQARSARWLPRKAGWTL